MLQLDGIHQWLELRVNHCRHCKSSRCETCCNNAVILLYLIFCRWKTYLICYLLQCVGLIQNVVLFWLQSFNCHLTGLYITQSIVRCFYITNIWFIFWLYHVLIFDVNHIIPRLEWKGNLELVFCTVTTLIFETV